MNPRNIDLAGNDATTDGITVYGNHSPVAKLRCLPQRSKKEQQANIKAPKISCGCGAPFEKGSSRPGDHMKRNTIKDQLLAAALMTAAGAVGHGLPCSGSWQRNEHTRSAVCPVQWGWGSGRFQFGSIWIILLSILCGSRPALLAKTSRLDSV